MLLKILQCTRWLSIQITIWSKCQQCQSWETLVYNVLPSKDIKSPPDAVLCLSVVRDKRCNTFQKARSDLGHSNLQLHCPAELNLLLWSNVLHIQWCFLPYIWLWEQQGNKSWWYLYTHTKWNKMLFTYRLT